MPNMIMMGVPIDRPSVLLGDNKSMVGNCTLPSSTLKKKDNAIAYHRVHEAVVSDIVKLVGHMWVAKRTLRIC